MSRFVFFSLPFCVCGSGAGWKSWGSADTVLGGRMGTAFISVALKPSITPISVKMDERIINTGSYYSVV